MHIVNASDKVTVFRSGKTYESTVLGSAGEEFWLLVLGLNEVQRGHLINIFEHQGLKCLSASEWDYEIESMFDANGKFNHCVFSSSPTPPQSVIDQLKAYHLIGAFKPSAA